MSNKLEKAFLLTDEEHAEAFERYANAFLVDDYPELQALGGKKDRGMDARVYNNETGKTELVVQSCVSPATAARTKVLKTIEKLKGNMPGVLIYCTSMVVGTVLDKTEQDLRKDHKVTLVSYKLRRMCSEHAKSFLAATFCTSIPRFWFGV
jgi:hypothetical protein